MSALAFYWVFKKAILMEPTVMVTEPTVMVTEPTVVDRD